MIVDFQVNEETDLVVDIEEEHIPYWVRAYELVFGITPDPVESPFLKASVEMPYDGVGSARRFIDDDE